MKRLIGFLLLSFVAVSCAFAQLPQPPEVAARSYLLLDLTTHTTLSERNADAPADPASLTKLMTAYVVFGALRDRKLTLEQTLPVTVVPGGGHFFHGQLTLLKRLLLLALAPPPL